MNRREFAQIFAATGAALATTRAVAGPGDHHTRTPVAGSVEDTPVILEVAINGSTTKGKNPIAPETPEELGAEAIRCFDAGATIVHVYSNCSPSALTGQIELIA